MNVVSFHKENALVTSLHTFETSYTFNNTCKPKHLDNYMALIIVIVWVPDHIGDNIQLNHMAMMCRFDKHTQVESNEDTWEWERQA